MIREEFSRLIYMYQEAAEGKGEDMQLIFQKSVDFIGLLKQMLIQGDDEDKVAAMRMMEELQKHMKEQLKVMSKKSGITEEQLIANAENPANFTKEQWQKMEETKEKFSREGKELLKILHEDKSNKETLESPASIVAKESMKKKGSKGVKKAKRSDWMRS